MSGDLESALAPTPCARCEATLGRVGREYLTNVRTVRSNSPAPPSLQTRAAKELFRSCAGKQPPDIADVNNGHRHYGGRMYLCVLQLSTQILGAFLRLAQHVLPLQLWE